MRLDRPWVPLVLVTDRWWIETGVRLPGVRATVHLEWSDRWEDHARPHVIAALRVWRFLRARDARLDLAGTHRRLHRNHGGAP